MLPRFEAILLSVTEACHVGCSHCGFLGSTRDREGESGEVAEWVRQSCEYGIGEIIFTGGEPFERLDVLAAGVRAAAPFHVQISVFTSSFWGTSFEAAADTLRQLQGLTHLYLSSDIFHQRRVPYQNVCNVIDAALVLGIRDISICITFANETEVGEVKKHYEKYGDRLMFHQDRVIPTPYQSSKVLKHQSPLLTVLPSEYKCTCYLGTPLVNPNGDLLTCHIGKAGAHRDLRDFPYYLGNLRECSFRAIMAAARSRWDYQFLRTHGPRGVAELFSADETLATAVGPCEFTTGCDMCYAVMRTKEGRATLSEYVRRADVRDRINIRLALELGEEPVDPACGQVDNDRQSPFLTKEETYAPQLG
jgi:hypothetical protein